VTSPDARYGALGGGGRDSAENWGELVRVTSHRHATRVAVVAALAAVCAILPSGGAIAASSPTTTIDSGPADGSYSASSSAAFTFSGSENPGDTFKFSCTLDGGTPTACDSGSYPTGALADGPHTFSVQATDENLIADPSPPTRSWTVDTTAPSVGITSGPADGGFSNTGTPSFGFSATDANLDTVQCSVDGGTFADCSSPFSAGTLADGPHSVTVQATDLAGNQSSDSRSWTADTTPPSVGITSGPVDGTFSAIGSPSFGFSATDANMDTVQCSLDGGAFADCSSPFATGALGDGPHSVTVQATDLAGNQSSDSRSWTVDTTPPVTSDDAPTGFQNNPVTVTLSPDDGAGSGVASTTYSVDGGSQHTGTSVAIAAPASHANDGVHTISYFSTDNVGNVETANSVTVSIDTAAPHTTDNSPLTAQTATPPAPSKRNQPVTLTPTDPNPNTSGSYSHATSGVASTSYSVDGGAAQSGTSVAVPTPADHSNDGWHTITYHSVDNAGNVEATHTAYEYVDTTAPDTAITAASVGASASFSFAGVSGSDPDDPSGPYSFQCLLVGSGATAFTSCPSSISYTGLTAGQYTFEVRALDGAGNADPSPATETWTSTPGAASTTLVMPGTVTTDPGTGATSVLQNVDSALIPVVSGSSGALVANALAAASGQGTDVGIDLQNPIAGVDCPANWKCFDPKTIVFTVQQLGTVTGTPVYTFTLVADSSLRPKKLTLSGVKIFHDGTNVPNCNKPHPKTPVPGPICISGRTTLTGGDWQFQLITTINGRVRM
jgi:hypothetical protein